MKVIGITGSIASGKSTVAAMLKNSNIFVIDADELARRASSVNSPGLAKIIQRFGRNVLEADGSLNRKALGAIVFNDPKALMDLEHILHPAIDSLRKLELARAEKEGYQVAVYMAPLLFEKNLEDQVDKTIVIIAPEEMLMERIIKRDGISRQEAQNRLRLQMNTEEKIKKADEIIENNGTIEELFTKLQNAWKRLSNIELFRHK